MYNILQLNDMLVPELKEIAEQMNIDGAKKLSKTDLIYKILDAQALNKNATPVNSDDDRKPARENTPQERPVRSTPPPKETLGENTRNQENKSPIIPNAGMKVKMRPRKSREENEEELPVAPQPRVAIARPVAPRLDE